MSGTIGNAGLSTGRDCQIKIIGPLGEIDLDRIDDFDPKPQYAQVKSMPINSDPLELAIITGWSGTIVIDRTSSVLDDFQAAADLAFSQGGVLQLGALYQYIANPDGSVSTYQFNNANFRLTDPGKWSRNALVKQTFAFSASNRVKIS